MVSFGYALGLFNNYFDGKVMIMLFFGYNESNVLSPLTITIETTENNKVEWRDYLSQSFTVGIKLKNNNHDLIDTYSKEKLQ